MLDTTTWLLCIWQNCFKLLLNQRTLMSLEICCLPTWFAAFCLLTVGKMREAWKHENNGKLAENTDQPGLDDTGIWSWVFTFQLLRRKPKRVLPLGYSTRNAILQADPPSVWFGRRQWSTFNIRYFEIQAWESYSQRVRNVAWTKLGG